MEAIDKIYKIKKGITFIPKLESVNEIISEARKRQLHALKEPPVSFTPNASKNCMWEKNGILLLSLLCKEAIPSKKMIPNRVRHNPRTTQATPS